eukprot:TRINITY_DN21604_c0_g1_i1.p1 TRINITY_DN21604_c0_g1~~TRINITY_DN21604_c0_g1_i1.p1  ORF type:complete len:356 (+),score=78.95 TRINITY_DN21604_c0_g1_i1:121-1188(+)
MAATVVVLGGAGNLGHALLDLLVKDNATPDIISLDVTPHDHPSSQVHCHVADILNPSTLDEHFAGAAEVYHLASIISILPVPPLIMHRVNVEGTHNVIQKCQEHKVGALIYTSSLEVVCGDSVEYIAGDESAPIPNGHYLPYAASKTLAEAAVLAASSTTLRTVALRSGYIMGRNCVGLVHELVQSRARSGHYVTAQVPARISCVSPSNCARAHILAAQKADTVSGQAFFIRDFEANVVEMNIKSFEGTGIKVVLLPLWLAFMLAWLQDRLYRLFHLLGMTWILSTFMSNTIDVNAMNMAWRDICFTGEQARQQLGYDPAVVPLMSEADTMKDASDFSQSYYAELGNTASVKKAQ